jgi:indolepyruvate ferredoxin oxidoreductase
MAIDPRFLAESGREIFTGNELLVKGALETEGGVHLLTGYPGSPVAGFFDCLGDVGDLLKAKGMRAFQANNEALAAAALNGSQMTGLRGIIAMKNVGTHVASDALAIGNMAGAHPQGGAVVVSGEDPWCDSTQVPADSRFLFEHLRMPVVEPGTPQELKDWVGLSFKLSQAAGLFIGYIVTVAHADGGGSVMCRPNQYPLVNTNQKIDLETKSLDLDKVLLPPRTWRKELQTSDRFAKTVVAARELGINRIYRTGEGANGRNGEGTVAPVGFITTGMGRPYLEHVLHDLGLDGVFPILNMGMSFPVDVQMVAEFSKHCRHMIVVEERRSFLEKNIRDAAYQHLSHAEANDLVSRLYGKKFPKGATGEQCDGIPDVRGLNYSVLAQRLIPFIKSVTELPEHMRNGRLSSELSRLRAASKPKLQVFNERVVPRTPTFCPGCPHRDSSGTLLQIRQDLANAEYMKAKYGRGPVDLVAHGDTGCYTMLMFAPTEQLMHNYSGMGLGAGTGTGIDPFINNKQIVFMGDGTFFHSGQVAISNAVKAGQDICFIILENGTTAMTGHQEHAGTEVDLLGNRSHIQDIYSIVSGMKGSSPMTVVKLDPAARDDYRKALEQTILADGVRVIIADKECGITKQRTVLKAERKTIKEHGYLPEKTHMNITPEVCEGCLECTKQTACPGLTSVDTDYGKKIDTDLTWCVNDGACERVRAVNDYGTDIKPCPSFEQVTVIRNKRRRYTMPHLGLDKLPEPTYVAKLEKAGDEWRCHMAGVGGMGIGLVGALLVRAGHKEGYHVLFQDKKGLAIRNGGVYSQLTFVKSSANDHDANAVPKVTGSIPYGKADLLLGVDVLEAARAIDPREQFRVASPDRTAAVLNLHKQNTVFGLLGRDDFDPDALREEIYGACRPDLSFAKNLAEICEQRLGSKQFVNIMILGVAYQRGLIPVSHHAIAWAIKDTIRRDHRRNLKAFNIGRKLALEPRALPVKPQPITWDQLVTNKVRVLRKSSMFGRQNAERFEAMVQSAVKLMRDLPETAKYDLALRIYDLLQYQDEAYAKRYVDLVRGVYKRDAKDREFRATVAAIVGLAKVMLIKDEPYVAYLLTRYEKKQRDIAKYNVDVSNGDKLVYRHHTKPELVLGKFRMRFNITTTDPMLQVVRHMKWWRKLPGWHAKETAFREWYIGLLERVNLATPEGYEQAVKLLSDVTEVTGYREVRYPKQDRMQAAVEEQLKQTPKPQVVVHREVLNSLKAVGERVG